MRQKRNDQGYIAFFGNSTNKTIREFTRKYEQISKLLDKVPSILNAFHSDLQSNLSSSRGGRRTTYTSENILRMFIIMFLEGLSYRDLVIRVEHDLFLRQFARLCHLPVMDFSFLSRAFSALRPQTWKKVLASLTSHAITEDKITGTKQRVDTTVYETNIHYPTDSSLLWDSHRVLSRHLQRLRPTLPFTYRLHDKKARKWSLYISRNAGGRSKSKKRTVKRCYRKLIASVCRVNALARHVVSRAPLSNPEAQVLNQYIPLVEKVVSQAQCRILHDQKVPVGEKLFSIFEPHTELIKRGKARADIEYGHKILLAQGQEKFIHHHLVMPQRKEDKDLVDGVLEKHKKLFGSYPHTFATDKGFYQSVDKLKQLREKIPIVSICKKGRRSAEQEAVEKDPLFKDGQRFRAGIEGSISVLKRAFKLLRCLFKGFNNYAKSVACAVFCHNLVLLARL